MNDLFDNVWGNKSEIVVDRCVDITLPVRVLWLSRSQSPNDSNRLRSSSSVSQVVMLRFSHYILMTADTMIGFGSRATWSSDLVIPAGHQMTFKDALHILSTNLYLKIILPNWAMYLTKHTRKVDLAFAEMKVRYFKLS